MKVVLIQGAFDILNYGHIKAFKLAKSKGDFLIVALNTNELIRKYKKREPVQDWKHKKAIIESIRYVDMVVPIGDFSPIRLLERYNVDVFVIAPEWRHTKDEEIAYMRKRGGTICYTRRYKGVSTTIIKDKLLREHLNGGGQAQTAVA